MKFKFLKIFFTILIISNFLVLNTKAYNLFLDVNVWGICTIVKIYKNSHRVIWEKHFVTPELLCSAKSDELPEIIAYFNTIKHKRIKSNSAKLKIQKRIRILNKNRNKFSENDIFKLNSFIFLIALENI